jgi:prevent-host-death family protein
MKPLISATDFKAHCLSLLDNMEKDGEPITITRRGHPVAVLSPAPKNAWASPANSWQGKAEIIGDILNTDTAALWEVASAK